MGRDAVTVRTARRVLSGLAWLIVPVMAGPARAGWGPDGVTIKSATVQIRQVAACSDGAGGAYVAWQEGEILLAQHLLPTGDLDPLWPADGTVVSGVAALREALGLLSDGSGGFYAWWLEGDFRVLFITRIGPGGAVAGGWPTRGRSLGPVLRNPVPWYDIAFRPSVISDGAGGVYVAWSNALDGPVPQRGPNQPAVDPTFLRGMHLGPSNMTLGSWARGPNYYSTIELSPQIALWPQIALADDGGVFVAWAVASADPEQTASAWFLERRRANGDIESGWPAGGMAVAPFRSELLIDPHGNYPTNSMLAISPDGRDGLFYWIADPVDGSYSHTWVDWRLRRFAADGSPAPGWTPQGIVVHRAPFEHMSAEASARALPDGPDRVYVGWPCPCYTDDLRPYSFDRWSSGALIQSGSVGVWNTVEALTNGQGGLFIASSQFWYFGPSADDAFISVIQSAAPPQWTDWYESGETCGECFGDIGLAATGDGGVFFFWVDYQSSPALLARRFGSHGQVTAVDSESAMRGIALGPPSPNPFRRGAVASIPVRFDSEDEFTLTLFDVTGRELARRSPERLGPGAHSVRWDPSDLSPGVYLLRMRTASGVDVTRRWVVLR